MIAGGRAHESHTVQLGVLLRKACDQGAVVGLRAGDVLDQFRRTIALALGMDPGAEPGEKAAVVTCGEGLRKPA